MHTRAYRHQGMGHDPGTLLFSFAISATCHLVFFAILVFGPGHTQNRRFPPSVINVRMVTLPTPDKAPDSGKKLPVQAEIRGMKRTDTIQAHQKASTGIPPAAKTKKIKTSLKKKTFRSSQIVKNAITQIEKRVESSRPSPVADTIEHLKQKIGNNQPERGLSAPGESGATGKQALELIDIYKVEVAYQIQKNWAFSDQLAGGSSNLQACLVFKVMPNGEIREILFTNKSGNRYLDESAYKAIVKSNPVAPHPPGIVKPFVKIGLRFGPKGLI